MNIKIDTQHLPKRLRKKDLEEKLMKICKENDITFMAIFGSFARGEENKKSDIDIAIEFRKDSKKTLLDLIRIESKLKKLFKRKVDLGTFSSLSPYIIEDVKKEMIIIYEEG